MKRSRLLLVLAFEALICIAFSIWSGGQKDLLFSVMAFPFVQIGAILRKISLSGTTGNIISIVLYSVFCLLPSVYVMIRVRRKAARREDGLLLLLSIVLFAVIYMMINPADITRHFGSPELIDVNKAFLGLVIYGIIAGYLVLRALWLFSNSETGYMLRYLKILLRIVCIVLVYGIFGVGLKSLSGSFKDFAAANTDSGQALYLSYVFIILQHLIDILPYALNIVIIFSGLNLIDELIIDPYSMKVTLTAQKTGGICRISVIVIMLSQIALNILQLMLGAYIRSIHYTFNVPLLSIAFMLSVMLLTRYFIQGRELKHDVDSII